MTREPTDTQMRPLETPWRPKAGEPCVYAYSIHEGYEESIVTPIALGERDAWVFPGTTNNAWAGSREGFLVHICELRSLAKGPPRRRIKPGAYFAFDRLVSPSHLILEHVTDSETKGGARWHTGSKADTLAFLREYNFPWLDRVSLNIDWIERRQDIHDWDVSVVYCPLCDTRHIAIISHALPNTGLWCHVCGRTMANVLDRPVSDGPTDDDMRQSSVVHDWIQPPLEEEPSHDP